MPTYDERKEFMEQIIKSGEIIFGQNEAAPGDAVLMVAAIRPPVPGEPVTYGMIAHGDGVDLYCTLAESMKQAPSLIAPLGVALLIALKDKLSESTFRELMLTLQLEALEHLPASDGLVNHAILLADYTTNPPVDRPPTSETIDINLPAEELVSARERIMATIRGLFGDRVSPNGPVPPPQQG